jgi:hypothetical protein
VLEYGSEVWGIYKCVETDKVQIAAARTFLGVNRLTPIVGIEGDIGWDSTKLRIYKSMLTFWNRLLKQDDSTLCKHIFIWDHEKNYNNWSASVCQLFYLCNTENFDILDSCNVD